MVTQAQLAEQLGVSQQAVSFALNGTGTLSDETRERILEGAERLGYRKNMASVTMQTGKTRSIGLLVRGHADSRMPHSFVRGVTTWLDDHDYTLSLVSVSEAQLQRDDAIPLVFREHRVDGCLVLVSRERSGDLVAMLNDSRMPYIWINEDDPHNAAYPDDVFLGRRSAEILMEHGCQTVAYAGPQRPAGHYSEGARARGYRQAMEAAGRPVRWLRGDSETSFSEEDALRLLRDADRPDGIVCYGSGDADNLFIAARRLDLQVPEALKIIVIGEAGDSIGSTPYAVLRIPMYQAGIKAMEMLEERLEQDDVDVPSVAVRHEQLDIGGTLSCSC
jgi:LacI family transcriptional regulator